MNDDFVKYVARYNGAYLDILASHYGGDATINEIRVMNCIVRAHCFDRAQLGVSAIAARTGISKSTVSRSVLKLRSKGWIREIDGDADGRRRYLHLTPGFLQTMEEKSARLARLWIDVGGERRESDQWPRLRHAG